MAEHFYIDATFTTKDFYQLLVIMAYYQLIDVKVPCAYILMNNKSQISYEIVLNKLKDIITYNNNIELKVISISTDFEVALINGTKIVFKNIRHVGCLFHYVKNIRLNLSKLGLYNKNTIQLSNELLKELTTIPFKYQIDNKIFDKIFRIFEEKNSDNEFIHLYIKFKQYYKDNWIQHLKSGSLNYIYLSKKERSNSCIENYNRRIKEKLDHILAKRGRSIVVWPLFIMFIINDENYYNNLITYKLKTDLKNIQNTEKTISYVEKSNELNNNPIWLKYNNYSCRYDTFFFYFIQLYIQN